MALTAGIPTPETEDEEEEGGKTTRKARGVDFKHNWLVYSFLSPNV